MPTASRALLATSVLLCFPLAAHAAVVVPTQSTRVTIARAGATDTALVRSVSGGGVRFTEAVAAMGTDKFRVSTVTREAEPLRFTSSFGLRKGTSTVMVDLSPRIVKMSAIEMRVAKLPRQTGAAGEKTYVRGTPSFSNVTFTAARVPNSPLAEWAKAQASGTATRKDITIVFQAGSPENRKFVLRGALPVVCAPLEMDAGGIPYEALEVSPQTIEFGSSPMAFGTGWLDATTRGADPRAEVTVSLLDGATVSRSTTYAGAFVTLYKTDAIDFSAPTATETWEIQPSGVASL